jgi:uncharacterized protein (DUF2147 family)
MIRCAAPLLALVATAALAEQEILPAVVGEWSTPQGTTVTIAACPTGLCGFIGRIKVEGATAEQYDLPDSLDTGMLTDAMNPDAALRSRLLEGLHFMSLTSVQNGVFAGTLYNPEDGRTYEGQATLTGPDTLSVKGCFLYVVCQEQSWIRVMPPTE